MLLIILTCIISLLITLKIYQKMTHKTFIAQDKMTGKVVIITGANTGIGLATAKDLAARGAKVILACRNEEKAQEAVQEIIKSTGNTNVYFKHLDLKSFKSVRAFAEDILKTEPLLDVLINNAGTGVLDNSLTEDNLPIEAQVNHFSPFLLTMLLLPLLKCSAPSRIIIVSSLMHKFGNIENLDKQAKSFLQRRRVYSDTKLANILFTIKLSEHLRGTRVTVNCLHPGAVNTDIFRNQPRIIKFLLSLMFLSPKEGAQSSIFLSVAKEMEKVTGKYFSNCTVTTPAERALDYNAADKLWKMSQIITANNEKSQ